MKGGLVVFLCFLTAAVFVAACLNYNKVNVFNYFFNNVYRNEVPRNCGLIKRISFQKYIIKIIN